MTPPEVPAEVERIVARAESLLRGGDAREAHAWLASRASVIVRSTDRAAIRRAENLRGAAAFELGELDEAEACFANALERARDDGDELLAARASNNLGAIANIRGRRELAAAQYQLAIPAYQRLGHVTGLAESYHNLAMTHRFSRVLGEAEECELRAIEFARAADNARLAAMARVGRAEIALLRDDARMAEATARQAAQSFAAMNDEVREADAWRVAGLAQLKLGRLLDAHESVERAVVIATGKGAALVEAESRWARAQVLAQTGDEQAARDDAQRALTLFERLGATEEVDAVRAWLAK